MVALALVLPSAAVLAREEAETSPAPTAVPDTADAHIEELRALVPEQLAGIPLREELTTATGEELAASMSDDERAVFEEMLAVQGKTLGDYAAANAYLPISDTEVVVVQAHRVDGIDAELTVDVWLEILGLNTERPRFVEESIAGRSVMLVSDDARPGFPLLNLFAAGDVVWVLVAADGALAEEAVRVLSAAAEQGETDSES